MSQQNKPRITWEKIIPKIAVWCKTEDEAKTFVEAAMSQYPEQCKEWEPGETNWSWYQEATCYNFGPDEEGLTYGPQGYYIGHGYAIIPFSDLAVSTKPRLCEVLGVEEDEVFCVEEYGSLCKCRIHGTYRECISSDDNWYRCNDEELLAELIADPDLIIRKPYSEYDAMLARAIKAAYPWAQYIARTSNKLYFTELNPEFSEIGCFKPGTMGNYNSLPDEFFPSIRPRRYVSLEDIIAAS